MASVRKRKWTHEGKPQEAWCVEYTDSQGKRRRKTPASGLKKDADKLRLQIEQQIETGDHTPDSQSLMFVDLVDAFMQQCRKRVLAKDGMTNGTVYMYATCVKRLKPILPAKLISQINFTDLQAILDKQSQTYSARSINHDFMILRLAFDFAVANDWIKRNPLKVRKLRLPAIERTAKIPSKAELEHVLVVAAQLQEGELAHAPLIRSAIVTLALFGGMRRGEICGLRWEDVDLETNTLHIRKSLSRYDGLKNPKTKKGVRDVPLSAPIRVALEGIMSDANVRPKGQEGFVITSRTGRPLLASNVNNHHWPRLMKAAGMVLANGRNKYKPHEFRHAAASLLVEQGVSPIHIQNFMGHAKVQTTLDVYGHLFPTDETLRLASDVIAARLSAPPARQEPPKA